MSRWAVAALAILYAVEAARLECAARRDGLALCEASEPLPFGDARRPRAAESITGCWCAPGDGPEEARRRYGADPERLSDDATAPLPDQNHQGDNTNPSLGKAVHGQARAKNGGERADVANLQTEAEAMKEEIQQLRARAQQETLEREHAAVGAATAEVSRLRDELDAVLAVGDAKLRSAERLCSKLRGDGDRKAAAIDTLELRIADADARRDAAEAKSRRRPSALMKEEAQRADRLAEAAKDADAGLAQQLEAETARREEAEAALASLRAASPPPPPVPPRARGGAPSSTPPTSPRNPGPPADLGAAFLEVLRSGVAAVAWEDGASEPVQLELRAGAPSAPGAPFALAGAQLCFVVEHVALPAPEAAAAPRASGALRRARRRRRRGGPRRPLHRPRGGGRRPVAARGRPRVPDLMCGADEALAGFRHALDALQHHPHVPRSPPPSPPPPVAATSTPGEDIAATPSPSSRMQAPPRAREQPEDDAPDARDAERRQPRLGEDRGI